VLLAEGATSCLEPTLLSLHGLGLTPAPGGRDCAGFLFTVCRLLRLRRFVDAHDGASLRLELERMRLEAGDRGVKLSKVHGVCGLLCIET